MTQEAETSETMLKRLKAGQVILRQGHAELFAMKDAGIGTEEEKKFLINLQGWVSLEVRLRTKHKFKGCIQEPEHTVCEPGAVVRCSHCNTQSFFHFLTEGKAK